MRKIGGVCGSARADGGIGYGGINCFIEKLSPTVCDRPPPLTLPFVILYDEASFGNGFRAVPSPPKRGEYLLVFHELPGVGLCLNGRMELGNTPALVVGEGTRMTVRCLNATPDALAVAIQGHRWERGNHYTDVELLPPGGAVVLASA